MHDDEGHTEAGVCLLLIVPSIKMLTCQLFILCMGKNGRGQISQVKRGVQCFLLLFQDVALEKKVSRSIPNI